MKILLALILVLGMFSTLTFADDTTTGEQTGDTQQSGETLCDDDRAPKTTTEPEGDVEESSDTTVVDQ